MKIICDSWTCPKWSKKGVLTDEDCGNGWGSAMNCSEVCQVLSTHSAFIDAVRVFRNSDSHLLPHAP